MAKRFDWLCAKSAQRNTGLGNRVESVPSYHSRFVVDVVLDNATTAASRTDISESLKFAFVHCKRPIFWVHNNGIMNVRFRHFHWHRTYQGSVAHRISTVHSDHFETSRRGTLQIKAIEE
jgi:hypothetical protein